MFNGELSFVLEEWKARTQMNYMHFHPLRTFPTCSTPFLPTKRKNKH